MSISRYRPVTVGTSLDGVVFVLAEQNRMVRSGASALLMVHGSLSNGGQACGLLRVPVRRTSVRPVLMRGSTLADKGIRHGAWTSRKNT